MHRLCATRRGSRNDHRSWVRHTHPEEMSREREVEVLVGGRLQFYRGDGRGDQQRPLKDYNGQSPEGGEGMCLADI